MELVPNTAARESRDSESSLLTQQPHPEVELYPIMVTAFKCSSSGAPIMAEDPVEAMVSRTQSLSSVTELLAAALNVGNGKRVRVWLDVGKVLLGKDFEVEIQTKRWGGLSRPQLLVGKRLVFVWRGGDLYPGMVVGLKNGTFEVIYDKDKFGRTDEREYNLVVRRCGRHLIILRSSLQINPLLSHPCLYVFIPFPDGHRILRGGRLAGAAGGRAPGDRAVR